MAEEPCWGRGLIIKQLGNLFSIIHVVLVTSGAGRGHFQKAAAMLSNTRWNFKVWSSDGDASARTPAGSGPLELQGNATALGELGEQKKSPYSLLGNQKGSLSGRGQTMWENLRLHPLLRPQRAHPLCVLPKPGLPATTTSSAFCTSNACPAGRHRTRALPLPLLHAISLGTGALRPTQHRRTGVTGPDMCCLAELASPRP